MPHPFAQPGVSAALSTDLYELTMALGYWQSGLAEREAEFHMFFRRAPFGGGLALFAGLGPLLELLADFRFSTEDLDYLAGLKDRAGAPLFPPDFLRYLGALRLSLDLWAPPEGTPLFATEPFVRVRGPLLQAQLVETLVLTVLNFQTLIATKAARICHAAQGDPVIDFGLRRAQGLDGGLSAARAAYIGGCVGSSNVLAGRVYGLPLLGTHAHSWVMAFGDEQAAFAAYAEALPNNCVFLVDTYDTHAGLRRAVAEGQRLHARGGHLTGVRLDSGDLVALSREARRLLDEGGLPEAIVFGSGDLDEHAIARLKAAGAAVGGWGVGTNLVTAKGEPALSGVYKLAAIRDEAGAWQPRMKLTEERAKATLPGRLQVLRCTDAAGQDGADLVLREDEDGAGSGVVAMHDPHAQDGDTWPLPSGARRPLMQPVLRGGRPVADPPALPQIREAALCQLARLPAAVRTLTDPAPYPVGISPALHAERERLIAEARQGHT